MAELSLSRAGAIVATRPRLWLVALRQMWRLRRNDWWKRAPFLPVPGSDYLSFRMTTALGDDRSADVTEDLVTYLEWCKAWPHLAR